VLALLADSILTGVFARLGYLAPAVLLLLAGAGLPLPEEVTLVGSGFLLHQGKVQFWLILATCYGATLAGDSIPYWLGRKLGMSAIRRPLIAKIVHPERRAILERRFESHGYLAVMTCRFLPGVRMPGFFTAGTLGMPFHRFLLCDGLAATVMIPAWLLLGRAFGEKIATLEDRVHYLNQLLGFVLLAMILGIGVHLLVLRRDRQVRAIEAESKIASGGANAEDPEGARSAQTDPGPVGGDES